MMKFFIERQIKDRPFARLRFEKHVAKSFGSRIYVLIVLGICFGLDMSSSAECISPKIKKRRRQDGDRANKIGRCCYDDGILEFFDYGHIIHCSKCDKWWEMQRLTFAERKVKEEAGITEHYSAVIADVMVY